MGTFRHPITLFARDGQRSVTVEALAGTRSLYTWIPRSVFAGLGIEPDVLRPVIKRDGTQEERGMAEIRVQIRGEQLTTLIGFAPDGDTPVLGDHTLIGFGLQADTETERLVRAVLRGPSPRLVENRSE